MFLIYIVIETYIVSLELKEVEIEKINKHLEERYRNTI